MLIAGSKNLLLNHFELTDAAFIINLVNTPGWLTFIGDRKIKTSADAEKYINNLILSYQKNGFGLYKVVLKKTLQPIGMCGLVKRDFLPDADIGFAMLPDFAGKGYAFEASQLVIDFAKTQLHLKKLSAVCFANNEASINLIKKLNMRFEKTIVFPGEEKENMLFGLAL